MVFAAVQDVLLFVVQVLVSAAVLTGLVWVMVRLISRMTSKGPPSPPGAEPTDRTDDEDRPVW
jgi:archaellum component FlaG (FlaF/FlaG flagellin family)